MRFDLTPVPPFRLDFTVWALRRRMDNTIDRWDGETYRRVIPLGAQVAELAVRQTGPPERPKIEVRVRGVRFGAATKSAVVALVERLLGLRVELTKFYQVAGSSPPLNRLAIRFRGMKPPRFPTVFEALVNAITCQQITLTLGIQLLNKVAAQYSPSIGDGAAYAFPRPQDVVDRTPDDFRGFGYSRQKGRAIIELAQSIVTGETDLEALADLDDNAAVETLQTHRGIGRWTAEYALLRGLGRTHIFPGDDVGARNRLQQFLNLEEKLDYASVAHQLRGWQPFGGLIYFHMLLDGLAAAGRLEEATEPP